MKNVTYYTFKYLRVRVQKWHALSFISSEAAVQHCDIVAFFKVFMEPIDNSPNRLCAEFT